MFGKMQSILQRLADWQSGARFAKQRVIFCSVLLTGAGIHLLKRFWDDYTRWYGLGQGGVPRNLYGYTLSQILTRFGSEDVHSTVLYVNESDASKLERASFLDGFVRTRVGPKPEVSKWAAPVRQLSGMSPDNVKQKLYLAVSNYADSSFIEFRQSIIEGGAHCANALHISDTHAEPARRFAARGPSEIYHIHPSDGSAHAIVSAADAKILIESGWSERHPLSGASFGGFPSTYIMIYAPRTEDEVAVHEMVARAATRYATKQVDLSA